MASVNVLKRVSNRAVPQELPETDNAILAGIERSSSGAGSLWADNNVTSITVGGGTSITSISVTAGASSDLTLGARGSTITLNESGDTSLDSNFTATSIVGALNEVKTDIGGSVRLLSTTTGIDGTATGTTNLYTVPTGQTVIVTHAIVRVTAVSGLSSVPKAGVGVAAGEEDLLSSQDLTGIAAVGDHYKIVAQPGKAVEAASTEVIKLGIDTAASATTLTLAVDLMGYFVGGTTAAVGGGAIETEWTSFTPTGDWTTNTTYTGSYRKVGKNVEMVVVVSLSGAPNASNLHIDPPAGLTFDEANLGEGIPVGLCSINDAGVQSYTGICRYFNSISKLRVEYYDRLAAANINSPPVSNSAPFTFGSGDGVKLKVSLPVTT